ncbi:hypothetical protein [Serratia marcescens]|uniref:hypothetical protein n=1 Tax=Serratia marcescens TaxID=615 RepID=UPI003CFCA5E5
MDNKLSELSKPVGHFIEWQDAETGEKEWCECSEQNGNPLYSQEYVSALKHESAVNWEAAASLNVENQELKKRITELEQAMRHIHGAALDITVPRVAIAKAAELAAEHAAMKEHSNG